VDSVESDFIQEHIDSFFPSADSGEVLVKSCMRVIESYQNELGFASRDELLSILSTWMGVLLAAVNIPLASFLAYGAHGAMGYISLVLNLSRLFKVSFDVKREIFN